MRSAFEGLLSRYGQSVTLICAATGESKALRAFVQLLPRREEHLPLAASPLGAVSRERWLYLGGGGQPLAPGDRVDTGELALVVQEAGTVFWRDEALYQRAILRRRREAAE